MKTKQLPVIKIILSIIIIVFISTVLGITVYLVKKNLNKSKFNNEQIAELVDTSSFMPVGYTEFGKRFENVDDDTNVEIIILAGRKNNENEQRDLKLLIADKTDGKYQKRYDYSFDIFKKFGENIFNFQNLEADIYARDLNGDGIDEILFFERTGTVDKFVVLNIFKFAGWDKGGYKVVFNDYGVETSLNNIQDLDNDGMKEIIEDSYISAHFSAPERIFKWNDQREEYYLATKKFSKNIVNVDDDADNEILWVAGDDNSATGTRNQKIIILDKKNYKYQTTFESFNNKEQLVPDFETKDINNDSINEILFFQGTGGSGGIVYLSVFKFKGWDKGSFERVFYNTEGSATGMDNFKDLDDDGLDEIIINKQIFGPTMAHAESIIWPDIYQWSVSDKKYYLSNYKFSEQYKNFIEEARRILSITEHKSDSLIAEYLDKALDYQEDEEPVGNYLSSQSIIYDRINDNRHGLTIYNPINDKRKSINLQEQILLISGANNNQVVVRYNNRLILYNFFTEKEKIIFREKDGLSLLPNFAVSPDKKYTAFTYCKRNEGVSLCDDSPNFVIFDLVNFKETINKKLPQIKEFGQIPPNDIIASPLFWQNGNIYLERHYWEGRSDIYLIKSDYSILNKLDIIGDGFLSPDKKKYIYNYNTEKMDGLLECGMASYPVSAIRILDLETGTHKLTIEDKNSKFDIMKWLPDSQNLVFTKSKSVQEKDPNSECYTGEYTDSEKFIFDIKMMKIVYNSFESEILKIWKNKNIPVVIQENSDNVLYLSGKEIDRSEKIIILNK